MTSRVAIQERTTRDVIVKSVPEKNTQNNLRNHSMLHVFSTTLRHPTVAFPEWSYKTRLCSNRRVSKRRALADQGKAQRERERGGRERERERERERAGDRDSERETDGQRDRQRHTQSHNHRTTRSYMHKWVINTPGEGDSEKSSSQRYKVQCRY